MVGRRPREYTRVSKIKLGVKIMERLLALNPDMDPRQAAEIATEAVRKHELKHGKASEIYHELKPLVIAQFGLETGDLGKVRALVQKVVAEVLRRAYGKGEKLDTHTVELIFNESIAVARERLRLPEECARYVIIETFRRLANYLTSDALEALEAIEARE